MVNQGNIDSEDTGIKYELRSIGGGYSEGSSVVYDESKKKIRAEVNLYGGSKKAAGIYEFIPPVNIQHVIERFFQAKRDASQQTAEFQKEISNYKEVLAQEIDKEVVAILQSVDSQIESAIKKAIRRTNFKYK